MTSDRAIAFVLGILTGLSRLPFVTHRLWEWDSVLYARALEQGFHVDNALAGSRPHPPGYIFYVGSAALGRLAGLDSNAALVAVSVVASGLAAASFYLLCRRFADRGLSALVTIAFVAQPLVWLYGEVAMPYMLLAPLGTVLALAFLHGRERGGTAAIGASALYGALAGFRQDVLMFLFPLWVWMELRASWRTRAASIVATGVACLLWFVPSALLSDGPAEYIARVQRQFAGLSAVSANSTRSVAINLVLVGDSLFWAMLGIAVAVAVLGLARALTRLRRGRGQRSDDETMWFFALWLLPPLLFYVLVHIGEWGLVVSAVPGFFAMFAWLVRPLVPRLSRPQRLAGAAFIAANALLGAFFFVRGDHPVFSASSLAQHDASTDVKVAYIRAQAADSLAVLAGAEVLVARYYAPGYEIWYSDSLADVRYERLLARPTRVLVYEPRAHPRDLAPGTLVALAGQTAVEMLPPMSGTLRISGVDIDAGR